MAVYFRALFILPVLLATLHYSLSQKRANNSKGGFFKKISKIEEG